MKYIVILLALASAEVRAQPQILEPRSGELFQTTRSGPGDIASFQMAAGVFLFPVGLPLIVTGGVCAIVDELVVSPVVDLVCLPYDLSRPRHGYFIRVTDDEGRPVAGAELSAVSHVSHISSVSMKEVTDDHGEIYASRLSRQHYIDNIRLSKDGFYESSSVVNLRSARTSFRPSEARPDADGRIVFNLRLRRISHPVEMVASSLDVPKAVYERMSTALFFDCEKGAWLPPYGKGSIADLKLEIKLSREPKAGERLAWHEPYQMKLTAVRPDDGFIVRDIIPDSRFWSDYVASTNGSYEASPRDYPIVRGIKDRKAFGFPQESKYCMMRMRTERAADGTIVKAHYGKLRLGRNSFARCYFGVQPNECSIEERR